MDVLLLMSIFRLYPRSKVSISHNTARKFLFLSACFCWHSRLTLREMDQKIKFGELSDYGASYLEFLFHLFKVFTLHVTLHDAAGAVREPNGKGPGYCYLIGQRPNSSLLGHVSGLLFGLYVKLSLPSLFNTVDFWSSMSCIVLDFEPAKNPYLRVGSFFLIRMFRDTYFILQKNTNTQCKQFGVQQTCTGLCETAEVWITASFPKFFLGWIFCESNKKCKILANLIDKEVENSDDHGCPKVRDLMYEKTWICSSYPFRHKTTLQCAERKAKLFGKFIMQHLNLKGLYCETYCQYIRIETFQNFSILHSRFIIEKLSLQDSCMIRKTILI